MGPPPPVARLEPADVVGDGDEGAVGVAGVAGEGALGEAAGDGEAVGVLVPLADGEGGGWEVGGREVEGAEAVGEVDEVGGHLLAGGGDLGAGAGGAVGDGEGEGEVGEELADVAIEEGPLGALGESLAEVGVEGADGSVAVEAEDAADCLEDLQVHDELHEVPVLVQLGREREGEGDAVAAVLPEPRLGEGRGRLEVRRLRLRQPRHQLRQLQAQQQGLAVDAEDPPARFVRAEHAALPNVGPGWTSVKERRKERGRVYLGAEDHGGPEPLDGLHDDEEAGAVGVGAVGCAEGGGLGRGLGEAGPGRGQGLVGGAAEGVDPEGDGAGGALLGGGGDVHDAAVDGYEVAVGGGEGGGGEVEEGLADGAAGQAALRVRLPAQRAQPPPHHLLRRQAQELHGCLVCHQDLENQPSSSED